MRLRATVLASILALSSAAAGAPAAPAGAAQAPARPSAAAEPPVKVKVADCERNPALDFWAAADNKFCKDVMRDVFAHAGVEPEFLHFRNDGMYDASNAVVLCSAFRTPALCERYDFPLQPLGRMHFGLYTTQSRADEMKSRPVSEWPKMRVGYSPVSQGRDRDREDYFERAQLKPKFKEYPRSEEAVEALRAGEIDMLFLYSPFGRRPEGLAEIVPIGSRNVYFAVRKDHPELLKKLAAAYRECYIDNVDLYDRMKKERLGVEKPRNRVRVAAYVRGGLFDVDSRGGHVGTVSMWMKALAANSNWNFDYVYGEYDQSLADVRSGRLDMVCGLGFSASRRKDFFFPHTPMGMLRVYLWTRHGSPYKPGHPETWRGMKAGLLAGTISATQVKRTVEDHPDYGISWIEYESDMKMLRDYAAGKIDACVDVEMPELAGELALQLFVTHPMYICMSMKRTDLHETLERTMEEICDDFPKYMRMITEHHYGDRGEMSAFGIDEMAWIEKHKNEPVYIDFSPWPYPVFDENGSPLGVPKALTEELSRRTGLKVLPQPQTDAQTASAKFMRRETKFWVPFPYDGGLAIYKAKSVFALPVPQSFLRQISHEDIMSEFEMFASAGTDEMLSSILRKTVSGMDAGLLQEIFINAAVERRSKKKVETQTVHDVFGLDESDVETILYVAGIVLLAVLGGYGFVMILLLKREARRANANAARAEESAQAKTRFLAMMSHELRTPLNAVIGFAEFLARDSANDPAVRKDYTDGILTSSNALLQLINDILDLSKLEAGAMNMRRGRCDISALMRELPSIFGYRVRKRGVELDVKLPPGENVPPLKLSPQGIRQMLMNLVGNSAKFTEKGLITVRAEWFAETRTLHLEVSDTGCGMSDEKKKHLFDPFVQDIKSRMSADSADMKGTGLGLPIVKRLVDAAGGKIEVSSTLGEGTTFAIDIPDLEISEEEPDDKPVAVHSGPPQRVLVVDDMVMNRKILSIHLRNIGVAEVQQAENGVKALALMNDWVPDLVLTDMWMPEMDGSRLAEEMRKRALLAKIPVVAVTADVDVGSTYDMSYFAKVIAKPVSDAKIKALFAELS